MSNLAHQQQPQWRDICAIDELTIDCGACALVDGQQIAVFRLRNGELYAVDNRDPIAGANVLSRGLIAEVEGRFTVSSPLYRHHYCLDSGRCLQDESVSLTVFEAKQEQGRVYIAS